MDATEATELVDELLFGELHDLVLTEFKELPKPWPAMSQEEQDDLIERTDKRIEAMLTQATRLVVAHEFPWVPGKLEGVSTKGGKIKATVIVEALAKDRYHLFDAADGEPVMVTLADHREFMGTAGTIQSEAGQPDLPGTEGGEGGGDE